MQKIIEKGGLFTDRRKSNQFPDANGYHRWRIKDACKGAGSQKRVLKGASSAVRKVRESLPTVHMRARIPTQARRDGINVAEPPQVLSKLRSESYTGHVRYRRVLQAGHLTLAHRFVSSRD